MGAPPEVEIPALRSAFSTTYDLGGGRRTIVGAAPLNWYEPGRGFRPIDNTLTAATGGWTNTSNSYTAVLPFDLGQAVRFANGGSTVSYRLLGSTTAGIKTGPSAVTYADAFPNVDVLLEAQPDRLKESFVLRNRAAG